MRNCSKEIEELRNTEDNWEGYGAPAPTAEVIWIVESLVCVLDQCGFTMDDIGPDAMGGANIYISLKTRDAWICVRNDQNAIILTTHSKDACSTDRSSIRIFSFDEIISKLNKFN